MQIAHKYMKTIFYVVSYNIKTHNDNYNMFKLIA